MTFTEIKSILRL